MVVGLQVIVVVLADWTVICLNHNLQKLWYTTIRVSIFAANPPGPPHTGLSPLQHPSTFATSFHHFMQSHLRLCPGPTKPFPHPDGIIGVTPALPLHLPFESLLISDLRRGGEGLDNGSFPD